MSETLVRAPLVLDDAAADLLFRDARTPNNFSSEPVSDKQLRAIYELIKWAPTAFNAQPLRVVLVRSAAAKDRLLRHLFGSNAEKARSAPLVAILAADLRFDQELPRVFPHFPQAKDVHFSDPATREEAALSYAQLQVGYFILGVRAAGLAAGPMIGYNASGIDLEFFPDGEHKVLTVVNIGKPGDDPWFQRLPRLEYEEVFSEV
ncbi:malonic semialdehyde reductase [Actinocrinis sp.]|uniref:malonic semialdehyde reductase n=1 Tax=Actinocrinis sp. TaxID=1920516 RepID=UPI002D5C7C5E|nr:malonic semialdehyde reductase [Actinocrinis sp.]HZP50555.1 malonic semialdehyde reductase [Actinocrinis sp.]